MIGLSGHPTLARGVTLLAAARETKSVGGQDTVGDHVGPAVMQGVRTLSINILVPWL